MSTNHSSDVMVCLVTPQVPPFFAGAGKRVYDYALRLDKAGRLTALIANEPYGVTTVQGKAYSTSSPRQVLANGKQCFVPFCTPRAGVLFPRFASLLRNGIITPFWLFIWFLHFRQHQFVVHCFSVSALTLFAVLAAKVVRKKTIIEMTHPLCDSPVAFVENSRPAFLGVFKKWLFAQSDVVVAISPALRRDYQRSGLDPQKLRLVPNPVDVNLFSQPDADERVQLRRKLGISVDADPIVLLAGAVVRDKGVEFAVTTFLHLIATFPHAFLLVVGPNSSTEEQQSLTQWIHETVKAADATNRILVTGHVTNVHDFMKISDFLLFFSKYEGFGNVVIEAMASGTVVLARRLHGVTDYIVKDGIDGFLFENPVEDQVCTVIENLRIDRQRFDGIVQKARQTVMERFTPDIVDNQYLLIYSELHNSGLTKEQSDAL